MDALNWAKSLWPAQPIGLEPNLEMWRKWLIDMMVLIITVFMFPAIMLFTLPTLWAEQHYFLMGMDGVFYGLMLFHVFTKGRGLLATPPMWLFILYGMTIAHFICMGPHYPRSSWLIICAICAVLIYGPRAAFAASGANAAILIGLSLMMGPENQAWKEATQALVSEWMSHVVTVSLLSLGISLPVGFLLERLDVSLKHERTMRQKLERANADLAGEILGREKIEFKLRERDHELSSIITHTPDIIYRLNPEGRIDFISGAVERYGYTVNELKGKDIIELVHPEDREQVKWQIRERRRGHRSTKVFTFRLLNKRRKSVSFETRCDRIPQERFFSLDAEGLYDENGSGLNFLGTQGIARDITERIKREEEKKELIKQLHESQRLEAIGTLAGGIAHDFNNILGGMIGYTELTLVGLPEDESKLKGYLSRIMAAGERAKNLVQQILAFSRQGDQEVKSVQMRTIVEESLQLLRATLPTTIEIKQQIDSESLVMASPTNMHQVVMNLCTNAYHAMRPEGGTLTVSLHEESIAKLVSNETDTILPGKYVVLSVSDTGMGMSDSLKTRIFEPYFTTKTVGDGSGLGLSVIHGIIRNQKGLIKVQSREGKGSTFKIYLPFSNRMPHRQIMNKSRIPNGNGEVILLVDDEDYFLDVMKNVLEGLNYRPIATKSSSKALEIFLGAPDRFDLIITDQTMPVMTGLQLVSEVRKVNANIPVFLCTGFSETICEETSGQYGITRFLMKPVTRRAIGKTVFEVLGDVSKGGRDPFHPIIPLPLHKGTEKG
jgi:PAS domain S-box-containing protein